MLKATNMPNGTNFFNFTKMQNIAYNSIMYPYHNVIRQRIKNGELIDIKEGYGDYEIVLCFNRYPYFRPIKKESMWRYKDLIDKKLIFVKKSNKND